MASSESDETIPLKLLVDNKTRKVLFALLRLPSA
jgi:hypothetical protein